MPQEQFSKTVTIRVPKEVYERLEELKKSLSLRSLVDATRILFGLGESPLAFIAILFDIRNDFKEFVKELKRLNNNLEAFLQTQAKKNKQPLSDPEEQWRKVAGR